MAISFRTAAQQRPNGAPLRSAAEDVTTPDDGAGAVVDRSIGDYLRQVCKLDDRQVEQIVVYHREHRVRFGEAAIALKLATRDDVLWALSQQFHYPYAASERAGLDRELVAAADPFSDVAEYFRDLRSQLLLDVLAPDQPRRALSVISANRGDGKSFVAANLAVTFSQLGGRTVLVDADMRAPRQHQIFRVRPGAGLSGLLSGRADDNVIHHIKDLPSLYVLPVGTLPPNPLELVQRPAFGLLIKELLDKFDHVVVDTPAAEHWSDSRVIAARCGAALMVGRQGRSQMNQLRGFLAQLSKNPVKLAGILVNEH